MHYHVNKSTMTCMRSVYILLMYRTMWNPELLWMTGQGTVIIHHECSWNRLQEKGDISVPCSESDSDVTASAVRTVMLIESQCWTLDILCDMVSDHMLCYMNCVYWLRLYRKMKGDGSVVDRWFGRTVIRTCTRLSYDDAQVYILRKQFIMVYWRAV